MDTVSEMNITTAPHCQRTTTNASEKKADAFFNESIYDAEAASFSKQQLTDHMAYQDGMEVLDSTLLDEVITARAGYDYSRYTEADVRRALEHEQRRPTPARGHCSCWPARAATLLWQLRHLFYASLYC